ncbi:MAG: glucokinase [Desulfovibrionaceae bacterium]|nr:glucokinase [Desulfovibrionaceae bacterium]
MKSGLLLTADIGGTFSRFALFRLEEQSAGFCLSLEKRSKITLSTLEFGSFTELLRSLQTSEVFSAYGRPDCAAMAVPGPVDDGICLAPNIPWPLRRRELEDCFRIPADLLNDFAAQGLACLFPSILDLRPILAGRPRPGFSAAVLGAGTGLGKAQILPVIPDAEDGGTAPSSSLSGKAEDMGLFLSSHECSPAARRTMFRRVLPSEGGHALFPFRGEEEAAFEAFARRVSGRRDVIGDMAVSGYALSLIHAFHNGLDQLLPPEQVGPLLQEQPLVLEWFARFLGRASRNFALETLALGGIYLSGGMIGRLPGLPEHPALGEEFRRSENQGHLLENLPLAWIGNPDAGLWGSAVYGLGLLQN